MMRRLLTLGILSVATAAMAQDFGSGDPQVFGGGVIAGAPTTTTTTLAVQGVASSDYTDAFVACWKMNTTTEPQVNDCVASAKCAAGECDIDEGTGDVTTASVAPLIEGATYGLWDASERWQCADTAGAGDCDELGLTTATELTALGWAYPDTGSMAGDGRMIEKRDTTTGYRITADNVSCTGNGFRWRFRVDGTSKTVSSGGICDVVDSTWQHVAMTLTSAGVFCTYFDGSLFNAPCSTGATLTDNSHNFQLSDSSDYLGRMDEVGIADVAFTAAEICKVQRCGIDGTLCTCDSGTTTAYKTCSVDTDCRDLAGGGSDVSCPTCSSIALCEGGRCRGRASTCVLTTCDSAAPS